MALFSSKMNASYIQNFSDAIKTKILETRPVRQHVGNGFAVIPEDSSLIELSLLFRTHTLGENQLSHF